MLNCKLIKLLKILHIITKVVAYTSQFTRLHHVLLFTTTQLVSYHCTHLRSGNVLQWMPIQ